MYIHNYQIHNVLNAYRKQLSQSPDKASEKRPFQPPAGDVAIPSKQGQPPAIVNQISTEIIDRIARFGPQSEFDNTVANQMAEPQPHSGEQKGIDFTYSLIDEQNRKTTQTLPMDALNALKYQEAQQKEASLETAKEQTPEKTLLDKNQNIPSAWKG